ncbi:hypothetical protein GUJ93_ZPchr0002g25789 [Zizania palustris]|uniref:Uncharacterized protein n=1 Tax=Zizania palustris TaxID=103762 RepID=A0A8J5VA01_ZIZPA|nr:hypothetical protein GUJ93_ZPchr0002g25789 [Zizania palustris]KAG8056865.1 hypothetical protein GUJ93_ZPchr0002g25789 [Zizania palustris]
MPAAQPTASKRDSVVVIAIGRPVAVLVIAIGRPVATAIESFHKYETIAGKASVLFIQTTAGDWSRMLSEDIELDDVSVFPIGTQPIISQSSGSEPSAVKKSRSVLPTTLNKRIFNYVIHGRTLPWILSLQMSNLVKHIGS